jgi:hypothetical protein
MTVTGVAQWYDLVARSKTCEAPQIQAIPIAQSSTTNK